MSDERVRDGLPVLHRVVVGVDDGPAADAALAFGCELAAALHVPVHAVHVYAEPHGGPETPLLQFGDPVLVARETLDGAIERVQGIVGVTIPVVPALVRGHVAATLIERGDGDGIVVVGRPPRRGRVALPEWATPVRTSSRALCPVAVVPAEWRPTSGPQGYVGPVTVGIERPCCGAMLGQAFRLAAAIHAAVHVVHAEPVRSTGGTARNAAADDGNWLRGEMERAAAPWPGVSWALEVIPGAPGVVLDEASRSSTILIVGRHATARRLLPRLPYGARHRLGTVARHLLRSASCPVLFVDADSRCGAMGERLGTPTTSGPA